MKLLKVGLSGVRGIVGETVTPELVMDFACAFGTFLGGGRVLVGRDTRSSGPMLRAAVVSALASTGCSVLDLGICPTPILQYLVPRLRARGGVSITAGHNGADWNALSFINRDGASLNEFQGRTLLDLYHLQRFAKASYRKLGALTGPEDRRETYFAALAGFLSTPLIRKAGFKIVIDPCNGAGAGYVDDFCLTLGCELVAINDRPSGFFPHDPEPRPRNAGEAAALVKAARADAGFVLSSDVGRVSLVSEAGETLSEEYTFPLAAGYYLEKHPGPVVTNASTSRMIDDLATGLGHKVIKTRAGQSPVIQALLSEEASVAGEGSGGFAARGFQPAFDGFLAMGVILEMMAAKKRSLSRLVRDLPKYHIVKAKVYCPPARIHSVVAESLKLFDSKTVTLLDGIRVDKEDGWVQVRASATEPMIRIIAENVFADKAREDADRLVGFISQLV